MFDLVQVVAKYFPYRQGWRTKLKVRWMAKICSGIDFVYLVSFLFSLIFLFWICCCENVLANAVWIGQTKRTASDHVQGLSAISRSKYVKLISCHLVRYCSLMKNYQCSFILKKMFEKSDNTLDYSVYLGGLINTYK